MSALAICLMLAGIFTILFLVITGINKKRDDGNDKKN